MRHLERFEQRLQTCSRVSPVVRTRIKSIDRQNGQCGASTSTTTTDAHASVIAAALSAELLGQGDAVFGQSQMRRPITEATRNPLN
jgi:hypothetical protein